MPKGRPITETEIEAILCLVPWIVDEVVDSVSVHVGILAEIALCKVSLMVVDGVLTSHDHVQANKWRVGNASRAVRGHVVFD